MKKTALYILLFAYTTAMLKPMSPYIADTIAHIFYYSQHLATVHYENGKLHVHKEIIANAKKDEPAKEIPSSKKESSANDHIALRQKETFHRFQKSPCQISYTPDLLVQIRQADSPPPRA